MALHLFLASPALKQGAPGSTNGIACDRGTQSFTEILAEPSLGKSGPILSDIPFPPICNHMTVALRKPDLPLPEWAISMLSRHLPERHYPLNHSTVSTPDESGL